MNFDKISAFKCLLILCVPIFKCLNSCRMAITLSILADFHPALCCWMWFMCGYISPEIKKTPYYSSQCNSYWMGWNCFHLEEFFHNAVSSLGGGWDKTQLKWGVALCESHTGQHFCCCFQWQVFLLSLLSQAEGPMLKILLDGNVLPSQKREGSEVTVLQPENGIQGFFSFNLCFQSIKICT